MKSGKSFSTKYDVVVYLPSCSPPVIMEGDGGKFEATTDDVI
jgi:hypothetical protein